MSFKETGKIIQSVDLSTLMSWDPCYSEDKILRIADGRESLSADEINQLGIPADDRYWVLVHMLSDYQRHILTCEIAESVLTSGSDSRLLAAPKAKRAWLRGEISDEELKVAAYAASSAFAAKYGPPYSVEYYTACAATYAAIYAADVYSAADVNSVVYYAAYAYSAATYSAAYEKFCQMALNKIKEVK